jgi:hypothetical protein
MSLQYRDDSGGWKMADGVTGEDSNALEVVVQDRIILGSGSDACIFILLLYSMYMAGVMSH